MKALFSYEREGTNPDKVIIEY